MAEELIAKALELLESRKYSELRQILIEMEPIDIALLCEDLPQEKMPVVYRILPKELAAETFVELDSPIQEYLIASFSDRELRDVLKELYLDDTVDIIEEMPASVVRRIINTSTAENRAIINELLQYPDDSAGSIMTTEYVRLKKGMTVSDAFARIRATAVDKETIYNCYVTDENRSLLGVVTVKDLLLNPYEAQIGDIMDDGVIYATTDEDKESVAEKFQKYDLTAIPVTDHEMRLVGIVTVDDAIDVITEEATEDIEKMAAITPSDKPYLKTGAFTIFLQRIPWLLLLMVSATFTGSIIGSFEASLAVLPVLTAFIPMLMGSGGNAGSQASVAIIRGLALNEIELRDFFRVVWKESRVSLLSAVALGAATYAKIMLIDVLLMGNTTISPLIALAVCVTLAIVIIVAKLVGCTLPLLAKLMHLDPAVMASPFITTIVDAISLLVYFAIARAMLGI
jgi:magnesium transporter